MSARPGRHPEPPTNFDNRVLPITEIQREWVRLHSCQREPIHFGRARLGRFDAADGEFGVLYVAQDMHIAFVETLDAGLVGNYVTTTMLEHRCLSAVRVVDPLRLVDLTGEGLRQISADNRLATGDYDLAQHWSRAIFNHPAQPDGILYRGRHDPSRMSAALFDRVASRVTTAFIGRLSDSQLGASVADMLITYGFNLIE